MHLDKTIALILFLNCCSFGQFQTTRQPARDDRNIISKLRDDLLVNRNYDRMARPVVNASKTVQVEIKYIAVLSYDLEIVTGALSTNLAMYMSWTDEHLTWNKSAYQGLDQIIMDTNDVWMPTLQAWNSIYTASHFGDIRIGNNHPFVRVQSNGTVFFEPKPFISTKCSIDLTLYPSDQQSCVLLLGSFLERVPELNITAQNALAFCKVTSLVYQCSLRETKVVNKEGYPPFFQVYIDLKRKTAFYFWLIDLPYYSAVTLTLATFFIPLNTGSTHFKLKMTTLSFALFIMFFAFSLVFIEIGFHSVRTPYIVKCVTGNFLFNALSLMLICILNQNIQNAVKSPPSFLRPLQRLPFLAPGSPDGHQVFASFEINRSKSQQFSSEWIGLASVLDRVSLLLFIGLLVFYHA